MEEESKNRILAFLGEHGGEIALGRNCGEEDIQATFGMHKDLFMSTIAHLEEEGRVEWVEDGIRLKVKQTLSGAKFRKVKRKRR